MHNHDDKYPARPGFEPGTPRLQAPVDTNEPSGPAVRGNTQSGMSRQVKSSKIYLSVTHNSFILRTWKCRWTFCNDVTNNIFANRVGST